VKSVTIYTRRGDDWTDRYPLIVEAALHNLSSSFVIDGEGALLRCVKNPGNNQPGNASQSR
jgi:ATP-dependent DNA ligase